jgi:nucleoside 2-deoxyribosyltransferase
MSKAIRCFKTGGPCTVDVQEKPHSVFVIMPFAEAFDDVYELGIKASVEALGWECQRADEMIHNRDIMCQVCQGIRQARFIIADLTDRNANVFYELGMAHALEKDVILLAQDVGDVPFDLRQMNIVEYATTLPLRQRLTETLGTLMGEERSLAAETEEPRPGVHAKIRDVKDSTVVTAGGDVRMGK